MKKIFEWSGWRAAGKTLCFLLLLIMVLSRADGVLSIKAFDGLYTMEKFYEQEDESVDLLVMGSSHAFVGVDPGLLWEEFGIPSYDLGGGAQPFWNTYYFLKEALKTQKPRLVVLDAFAATFTEEYGDNGRAVSNTFGLKWSRDKIEAMKLSAPPDMLSSFLLGYCQYHSRSRELSREDFMKNKGDDAKYGDWKGSYISTNVNAQEWPADTQTEERIAMTPKTEEWYRKTIELAQSSGLPLLIVVNPYPGITVYHQAFYNTAADIAAEYGVPFVNFNQDFDALDLDPATGYYDSHHMNIWGSREFTSQLGRYLKEHYDLPDRRGDPGYQSWENYARYISAYAENGKLAQGVPAEEAASFLLAPDYTCAVAVSGSGGTAYASLLESLGLPTGQEGLWLLSGEQILWSSGPAGQEYFRLDYHDLKLARTPEGNEMVYDRSQQTLLPDGVSVFVYDAVTQGLAARLFYDAAQLSA